MRLPLASQDYARPTYGLAESRSVNVFAEATPGGPAGDVRYPRPGLVSSYMVGPGPIWGIFRKAGLFSGDRFTLSGNSLYRERTFLAATPSERSARWAGGSSQLVLITGSVGYFYNGTSVQLVPLPSGVTGWTDVRYLAHRFYYLQANTDTWWFSDIDDPMSIQALSFASNDEAPDADVGAEVLADEMWFFGQETVEVWYQTGDANNPLARSQGRTYSRGCIALQSIVTLDNALFFVDSNKTVCRTGAVAQRVSHYGVEERLRQCTALSDATAFSTYVDGHPLYVLNIPGQTTFAYDVSTGRWDEWESYGQETFRGRCAVVIDGVTYVGDGVAGAIWKLDPTASTDGDDPIQRIISCAALTSSGRAPCDSIALQTAPGRGPESGDDPQVQMRYSDDGGNVWSEWLARSLGVIGDYTDRPVWKKLGAFGAPGRQFEFRITDPVNCAFAGVTMNERRT